MINYEKVGEKLFSIIKGHGHNLNMFSEEGMETTDAAEARRFFVNKPNYMITLDTENNKIKFNKNSNVELSDIESVLKQVKNLASANMLKNEVQAFGKEITPKDFAYQAKKYKETPMKEIQEASLSRMSGSKKTSYQTLESVRMIVRHRKPVSEEVRGSRSRQISAIFLEQAGERFRFPHNCLPCARAMARHMYEGGNMRDTVGEYIVEASSNLLKLNEFIRYARTNKLINEANDDIIKTVRENITTIRGEFKKLTGATSYATMSEAIAAREATVIEENDTTELQNMFTVRKFDEKITDILPLVKRLMDNKQTWRNALVEASEQEISITEKTNVSEEDVFEFDSPVQQMGYKVKGIAERMVDESDLSSFVSKVAGKLIEGEEINAFEQKIVSNVLGNAVIKEEDEELCEDCGLVHEDCKCTPSDVIDIIADSYELKMKMIEHEDIFEEDDDVPEINEGDWDDAVRAGPAAPGGLKDCPDCRGQYPNCDRCKGAGMVADEEVDEDEGKGAAYMSVHDFDDHAGEVEAGAHSGMPEVDNRATCETCQGEGEVEDDPIGLCPSCDGSGKAPYDKGSRQDPFGGNYNVGVEDYMDDEDYEAPDSIFKIR
jgi:hypothetical protein